MHIQFSHAADQYIGPRALWANTIIIFMAVLSPAGHTRHNTRIDFQSSCPFGAKNCMEKVVCDA
jgi:hypothetical protein